MTSASTGLLLDTCALIWLANGDPLSSEALKAIGAAAAAEALHLGVPVLTRDTKILAFAQAGYIAATAC